MRVIVAGGRDFNDYDFLSNTLDKLFSNLHDDVIILCGKARGADALGEKYANDHGYQVDYYPADWDRYGKSAGYLRNLEMARNADCLVAFWDGESKGTKHMIEVAYKFGLEIRVKKYTKEISK